MAHKNPCCCIPLDIAVRIIGYLHLFAFITQIFNTYDPVGRSATLGYCAIIIQTFVLMLIQGESKKSKRDLFISLLVASFMMYLVYIPFAIITKYTWKSMLMYIIPNVLIQIWYALVFYCNWKTE